MATGTATLDFGAFPGANEATVTVTGQTAITALSLVEAFFMFDSTSDHDDNDHAYANLLARLVCGNVVAATSFEIIARSEHKLQGTFQVRWVYT